MQNNEKELIDAYVLKRKIPRERVVVIDGECFDKEYDLTKDHFTGEWIRLVYDRYRNFTIAKGYDEQTGCIISETVRTKQNNLKLILVQMQYNNYREGAWSDYVFESAADLKEFCEKYDFVLGKLRNIYFHITALKFDRKKPQHFDGIKSAVDVDKFLYRNDFYPQTKNYKKSREYRELQEHLSKDNYRYGMDSKTFLSFEGLQYTFGVEMETVSGIFTGSEIVKEIVPNYNMSSVHDGSLRDADGSGPWGAEYVTGVLKGDNGLKHLHSITDLLSKKCTVDRRTSVHVHIGSLKWNSEEIVYAYILGKMLEDEIFSMMPKSRANNEYCKKLKALNFDAVSESNFYKEYKKNIKTLYADVFSTVSNILVPDSCYNKKSVHPRGRHGGYDRATDHRYSWLNFTNIIFNQRGNFNSKTIEFRCHSGTLSYKKIHNWIKICMAFVEYVHVGKKEIMDAVFSGRKITLEQVIKKVYPKTNSRLLEYISIRKNLFNDMTNETVDYVNESSNIKNLKDIICV